MWVNNKPISPIGRELFKKYFNLDVVNFRDMGEDLAFSLLGRHVARAEEAYLMLGVIEGFLKEVHAGEETFATPVIPENSEGFGFTEAPRGSLMHYMQIKGGKIENYQIIPATLWNCGPRNDKGCAAPWKKPSSALPWTTLKALSTSLGSSGPLTRDWVAPCTCCTQKPARSRSSTSTKLS